MGINIIIFVSLCLSTETLALWKCKYYPDEFLLENPNTGEWSHLQRKDNKKVNDSPPDNVLKVLEKLGLTKMLEFMKQTALDETLSGEGPFTIFSPTNHSFDALKQELKDNLTSDNAYLRRVLQHHIVPGRKMSWDMKPGSCFQTQLENISVAVNYNWNNKLRINEAPVLLVDAESKNGVVHVIQDLLIPPDKPGCPYKEYLRPRPPYVERGYEHPQWGREYSPLPQTQESPNYYPTYSDFANYQHG